MIGKAIHIKGVVQGVGFRPFVYHLAQKYELKGWVRNTSAGVDIRAEGTAEALQNFLAALTKQAPPLARIDDLTAEDYPPQGYTSFEIFASTPIADAFQPVSADIAICADCLQELRDPTNHRYHYPFINCTHCGPRFTIITDIPYDRPRTTMADFQMCSACAGEYHNPADRRFHAQPAACAECGPKVWLENQQARLYGDDAILGTALLLKQGKIVAIKGLGGFHLACDATHADAVSELRRRKERIAKPFALMMADLGMIQQHCVVSDAEMRLLTAPAAPIVLLRRREDCNLIRQEVTPGQNLLGVMLPYTPLHVLLFDTKLPPLVMTSGNHSEEPIVTDNADARELLADLADAFLMHNRDIHIQCDDSVMRIFEETELPIRRSRGYAPYPVRLPFNLPSVLAVGGEMKNTFCITRDDYAFMSHHIGEISSYEALQSFERGVAHFEHLFRVQPQIIAHDLHPDYLTTRYAQIRAAATGITTVPVQHHHAHIAAVLAEHNHTGEHPAIGVCFDGTGYGTDGTIWGGEFLLANYAGFERAAFFKPVRLPGGDAATRNPARIALSYLLSAGAVLESTLPPLAALTETECSTIEIQIKRGINAPFTSSMGRLFDAVSSLIGVCQEVTYEGQAAIELEAIVDPDETGTYAFTFDGTQINSTPVIHSVINDLKSEVPASSIAARFHNGIARMIQDVCLHLKAQCGLNEVVLSGGVFQNVTLLQKTLPLLRAAGFTVYTHRFVPPNDGGIALGQAVIAAFAKAHVREK